jgi:hypothetical protein
MEHRDIGSYNAEIVNFDVVDFLRRLISFYQTLLSWCVSDQIGLTATRVEVCVSE